MPFYVGSFLLLLLLFSRLAIRNMFMFSGRENLESTFGDSLTHKKERKKNPFTLSEYETNTF